MRKCRPPALCSSISVSMGSRMEFKVSPELGGGLRTLLSSPNVPTLILEASRQASDSGGWWLCLWRALWAEGNAELGQVKKEEVARRAGRGGGSPLWASLPMAACSMSLLAVPLASRNGNQRSSGP